MNEPLFEGLPSAAPSAPSGEALARVATAARERAGRGPRQREAWGASGSTTGARVVRIAASVAAAAAVIAAAVWAWSPRVDDSAFARQQAMAALKPQSGLLHTRSTFSVRSWNETDGKWNDFTLDSEDWVDIDKGQTRNIGRNTKTGDLSELSIRSGDVVRSLGRDAAPDPKTGELTAPGKWRVVQYEEPFPVSTPGGAWVDTLHKGLSTGEAEVVDKISQDGQEFWVLEMQLLENDSQAGSCKTTVKATVLTGSYQLRNLELVRDTKHPVDGEGKEIVRLDYSVWETIERSSLPADFFDIDQVDKAAPQGAIIERPLEK